MLIWCSLRKTMMNMRLGFEMRGVGWMKGALGATMSIAIMEVTTYVGTSLYTPETVMTAN